MKKIIFAIMVVIVALLFSCYNKKDIPYAKKLSSYKFNIKSNLISRVEVIPEFLLKNLMEMDKRNNYKKFQLSSNNIKILTTYLNLLPKIYKEVLKERLIKIYFVENLLGSGLTTFLFDKEGKPHPILIFNPSVFKMNMTDWTTYKVNTCFKKSDKHIDIKINTGKKYSSLMGILLHETSHVIDFHNKISFNRLKKVNTKLLFDGIWYDLKNPIKKYNQLVEDKISFYGIKNGPNIENTKAEIIYTKLMNTPFVSLYGSMNMRDDFAELMTYYILTKKLNQPYEIKILQNSKNVLTYEPMKNSLITKRFKDINFLLNNNKI